MGKGLSLHLGLNYLSKTFYQEDGRLFTSVNDARAMAGLAVMEGYASAELLLNEQATKTNFFKALDKNIQLLEPGDTFLLSFSGHGGQIADTSGDEIDGLDEVWCLYDDFLIDDEIGRKWPEFRAGVKIIVVSSSCHSETGIKPWTQDCFFSSDQSLRGVETGNPADKKTVMSRFVEDASIKAQILHLAACKDKQEAQTGARFSVFTQLLLKYWDYGQFSGDYENLVSLIQRNSGYTQQPALTLHGPEATSFPNQQAFKIY